MSTFQSYIVASRRSLSSLISSVTSSIPNAILAAALILALSHIAYGFIISGGTPSAPVTLFTGKPVDSMDYVEGKTDSKVVIIEYSDPECPYCITLHPTMKQIRTEYGDKVAFIYRHFPLTQIHPDAFDESKAIECAGTLGGTRTFYQYVDSLYGYKLANKTTELPATGKEDIAANVGLDKKAFAACLESDDTTLTIDSSTNDGVQAGVQGTPSSFILVKTKKGYEVIAMIDGARPYEYIEAAISEALSR